MTTRAMVFAGLVGWLALSPTWTAFAQNDTQRDLTRRADERLRVLHDEADRLAGEARSLLAQLRRLEVDRQIAREELHRAEQAVAEASAEAETLDRDVSTLERARDEERPRLASRFAEMYKLGRGRYLRMMLSTTDLRRVGRAARTVAALADRDQARVRAYADRLETLRTSKAALVARRTALDHRREEAARAQASVARAVAAQSTLVRDIDQRRDLNAQLVAELLAAQQRLDATFASVGAGTPATLPIGPFRGALPWPTTGAPVPTGQAGRPAAGLARAGLDIQAEEGAPVRAVHEGLVAFAGSFEGLGNLVILDHGDQTFSLYGHLLDLAVGRGVSVKAQQEIGRVGASATGAEGLRFELRVNGKPVDPLAWLERRDPSDRSRPEADATEKNRVSASQRPL